jgi:hypothetical protein
MSNQVVSIGGVPIQMIDAGDGTFFLGVSGLGSAGIDPPTFIAASTGAAASDATSALKPTGVVAGDVMVAIVAHDGVDNPLITGGAGGWTAVSATVAATGVRARVFQRVAGASEPGFYSIVDLGGVSTKIRGTIVAYRPASGTTLTVTGSAQANASGTSQVTPPITPSGNNAMLVAFGAAIAGKSWTPPSGMTERSDAGTQMTIGAFDVVQETAAAVTETATLDTAGVAVMAIVALVPTA